MTNVTDEERLERIEQGLNAVFATEVAREVLQAVDFEAILSDGPAEDPVDIDRLASAIGRPVGRVIVHRVATNGGPLALAGKTIGSEVGGRVAAKTFRVAVKNVDLTRVTETLVSLDEEDLSGSKLGEIADQYVGS